MKKHIFNLIQKILYGLDKKFNMPEYRVKHENVIGQVVENYIILTKHGKNENGLRVETTMTIPWETFYGIHNKVKSYRRKNDNTRQTN